MCSELRSKKEPVCGERMVHGSGTAVGLGDDSGSACAVVEMERKKARLQ